MQDLDDHCIVFKETYYLNNPAHIPGALGVAEQLQMKRTFLTTMVFVAQAWATQYATLYTYAELKTKFLGTFWRQR